jgi:hypothetical protein
MYSKTKDRVFYFSFLCFNQSSRTSIASDGFTDWAHLCTVLKSHESSSSHVKFYQEWIQAESRLKGGNTIEKLEQPLICKE